MESQTNLKCQKCSAAYQKPAKFLELAHKDNPSSSFYKRSIELCDKCRDMKETIMKVDLAKRFIKQ